MLTAEQRAELRAKVGEGIGGAWLALENAVRMHDRILHHDDAQEKLQEKRDALLTLIATESADARRWRWAREHFYGVGAETPEELDAYVDAWIAKEADHG